MIASYQASLAYAQIFLSYGNSSQLVSIFCHCSELVSLRDWTLDNVLSDLTLLCRQSSKILVHGSDRGGLLAYMRSVRGCLILTPFRRLLGRNFASDLPEIWHSPWQPGQPKRHQLPMDGDSYQGGAESPVYDRTGKVSWVASVTYLSQASRVGCSRICRRDEPGPCLLAMRVSCLACRH